MTVPATPSPVRRRIDGPAAAALAGSVLGVGALFLPAYAQGRLGSLAVIAWIYQLAAGVLLVVALVRAAGDLAATSVIQLAGDVLGAAAGQAVRWYYVVGVSVGQAVVAAVGGWFAAIAIGRSGAWPAAAWALLVLAAVAVAAGWSGRVAPRTVLGMTVASSLLTTQIPPLLPMGGPPVGLGAVVFMLFFAFVGWEAALRLARPGDAASGTGVVAGAGIVAAVYLVLAAVSRFGGGVAPAWLLRYGAAVAAVLCALACVRNLTTVTGLIAVAGGTVARRVLPFALAAVAGTALALVAQRRLSIVQVLAVPNAMALAVFCTATVAIVKARSARARPLAGAALLGYVILVPFAWPVVLAPLLVLLIALICFRFRFPVRSRPGARKPVAVDEP